MMQSITTDGYSQSELDVIQHCLRNSRDILQDFIDLLEQIETFVREVFEMIETLESIQIPYCYEYLRLTYLETFMESKENITMLYQSMFAFPNEIDECLAFIKRQPASVDTTEAIDMLKSTFKYFVTRFQHIQHMFYEHKSLAMSSYAETQLIVPKSCGL